MNSQVCYSFLNGWMLMDTPLAALDWSLVQAFLAVADAGSLSAAARRLGASQPTLGRQIARLEADLGSTLFLRQPRGLALSEAGQSLLDPARRMQAAMQEFSLRAAGHDRAMQGTVRITASEVISHHVLPPILAALRAAEPGITIDLVPSDETENLLFREADIAVRMYRSTQLDIVTRHLGEMEIGAFAARSYLARRGQPRNVADLRAHDLIGYDASELVIRGMRAAGLEATRDWFALRCDSQTAYWELVRAGCGIGFGLRYLGLADPLVEEIDLGLAIPRLPVWLAAHQAMRQTPRIRRVWEALAEGLKPLLS